MAVLLLLTCGLVFSFSQAATAKAAPPAVPSTGIVDPLFITAMGTGFPTPNSSVNSVAVQGDDKIIVGGTFTSFDGSAARGLVRLNKDGSLDTTFLANMGSGFNNDVTAVAVNSDGSIIVGGRFSSFNGVAVNDIARLNSDGTLDTGFALNVGSGFDTYAMRLIMQQDGKILTACNSCATFNGAALGALIRLNSDGTLDAQFTSVAANRVDGYLYGFDVQSDGKIVIGGSGLKINGASIPNLVRLNGDGSRDTAFSTTLGSITSPAVYAVKVQSDGGILAGGSISAVGGVSVNNLVRLTPTGSRDAAFTTNYGTASKVAPYTFVEQADGSVVAGGYPAGGPGLVRFSSTGVVDTTFGTNLGSGMGTSRANVIAIQSDGKILAGSAAASFNGKPARYLVRLGLPVDFNATTIEASPTSIAADGASTSIVTVTARDAFGVETGLSAGTVTMSSSAGSLGAVDDNGDGTYTATLTSSLLVESATIGFTIETQAGGSTASVDFVAGPPDLTTSFISASPNSIIADGASTSKVTVTLKDRQGHLVSTAGDIVGMATSAGSLGPVTNNGDGTYTATLTSSKRVEKAVVEFTVSKSLGSTTTEVAFTSAGVGPDPGPDPTPGPDPDPTPVPTPNPTPDPTPDPGASKLPVTGASTGSVSLGIGALALVTVGGGLLLLRSRKRA